MKMKNVFRGLLLPTVVCLSACEQAAVPELVIGDEAQQESCLLNHPLVEYNTGIDTQLASVNAIPAAASTGVESEAGQSQCADNTAFRFAAARHDITATFAGQMFMGAEDVGNYGEGLFQRNFARAFIIGSECNDKRAIIVNADLGMVFSSVRWGVLQKIRGNRLLRETYDTDSLLISATHTHTAPGGYAHSLLYNFFRLGFDQQTYDVIVEGIYQAILQAHRNYEENATTGPVNLAFEELLNSSYNRSRNAYSLNPEAERQKYLDVQGNEVNTNKLITQLNLTRDDGKRVGIMNWFGIHTTSALLENLVSSDNKGYAAYEMERMRNNETRRTGESDGEPFVAGFFQSDEGDSNPIQYHFDFLNEVYLDTPPPFVFDVLGHDHPSPNTVMNGVKQLDRAIELSAENDKSLKGGVDYRLFYVSMNDVTIDDPVILDALPHPEHLNTVVKRTCNAAMGVSFPSGDPRNVGTLTEPGLACDGPFAAQQTGNFLQDALVDMGCRMTARARPSQAHRDFSCQAEKPVLIPSGLGIADSPTDVPFQIVRIGNLAVIALPWEVTTMAGRRIRDTVLEELKHVGVDYAVIAGLSNSYVSYLTTREEYSGQFYEGASTQFGPWTLAAVQQSLRQLAVSMRESEAGPEGVGIPYPPLVMLLDAKPSSSSVRADEPLTMGSFGAVAMDAGEQYDRGQMVEVTFQGAHPRNDLKTEDSYLFVEYLQEGEWVRVAKDADPETAIRWLSDSSSPQFAKTRESLMTVEWHIPYNVPAGQYRIRYSAAYKPDEKSDVVIPFEGTSRTFRVEGEPGTLCTYDS